jgi:hypothetical protein
MDVSMREALVSITTVSDMVKAFQNEDIAGICSRRWCGPKGGFAPPAAIAVPSPWPAVRTGSGHALGFINARTGPAGFSSRSQHAHLCTRQSFLFMDERLVTGSG